MEALDGGYVDPVVRLEKFRAAHPEVDIMTPADTHSPWWKAYSVGGRQITVQHSLDVFMSVLELLAERNEL